jgi:hypothetical protein
MAKLQPNVAWRAEATAALTSLIEMAVGEPVEVELDAVATQAGPAAGVLSAAEDASMIVLGTRGCGGAASILLGSVGSEVLKRATCPVVTVPPERAERGRPPVDRGAATVSIEGVDVPRLPARVTVRADGAVFDAVVHIDTDMELEHFHHGGILPFVLRSLAPSAA